MFEKALNFHRAGRLDEAEELYRKVVEASPDHWDSLRLLGLIEHQRGNHAAAVRQIDAALKVNPNLAEAHNSRGNALKKMKRLDEALADYDQAIALKPTYAKALYNRGGALHELNRLDDALLSYDKAIALNPDYADAFNARGNVLKEMAHLKEALASYNRAIALNPSFADALKNRGTALHELGRLDEALASYDQALAYRPDYADAFNNRGSALHQLGRLAEAIASYDQAIALKPGFANAYLNRGMARLLTGRLREGWEDYEWRWKAKSFPNSQPTMAVRTWQGEDVGGRRFVIYAEQGLGDVIQFARYLPLLVQCGAKLTFLAPPKLVRLLKTLSSEIEIVGSIEGGEPFDFQDALISLPFRFGTELPSIPNQVPYLRAENDLVAQWKKRLGAHGFKIGIAWQGNPEPRLDRNRSIPLIDFASLSQVSGVRLISLQKHHGLDQLDNLPAGTNVETLGDDFDGGPDAFPDTAAVISCLDLVVSSDTSIAHLAGALGHPVWVALEHVPDWRWLLDREDCPWYPTMRLFRQAAKGDWKLVFSRIEKELCSQQRALGTD
jgi:tetratricopeptide (TPR) repeat protein